MIIPGLIFNNDSFLSELNYHYMLSNESLLQQKNYQIPLTKLLGKNDQIVGYKQQCQLVENSDSGSIILLDQTGHNIFIDQPYLTKIAFQHFLNMFTK